jgi:hypothetical protein
VGRSRCRQQPADGRFTRQEVNLLVTQAWHRFGENVADAPPTGTVGNRMNMRLACLSLSLFEAFPAAGIEREYAIELFADAAWKVYEMFLRFPFSPPGYRYDPAPLPDGLAIEAADLCVGAWRNLDYGLAEMWGGQLERSTTLAAGGERCDFRFHARGRSRSPTDDDGGREPVR